MLKEKLSTSGKWKQALNVECINKVNGHSEETPQSPRRTEPHDTDSSATWVILKALKICPLVVSGPPGSVVKSHSITNMETGGLKIYDIVSDNDLSSQVPQLK